MPWKPHRRLQGLVSANYAVQWTRSACGRRLDWIRKNNFLVLSAARSGTTLLVDYLNCSPQIRCFGEILGPGHYQFGDAYRMSPDRLRLHVESYFVKRPGKFVGAKIMTFHLDELPLDISGMLDLLDRPKIIVLYRESILERFVSLKLAERSGVWHVKKPTKIAPIWLDPDEFLAFAERERRMWRENFSALDGQESHILSYDQLASRPDVAMRGVFDFLGVQQAPVRSRLAKISRKPLWQKVTNFRQFADRGISAATTLHLPFADEHGCPTAKVA